MQSSFKEAQDEEKDEEVLCGEMLEEADVVEALVGWRDQKQTVPKAKLARGFGGKAGLIKIRKYVRLSLIHI